MVAAIKALPIAAEPALKAQGWLAELNLRFSRRSERTVLTENRHRGPLLVQRPFYPAADECHVYLLHPPAGIVGGDELELNIVVDEQAQALVTTPAANKFYRSAAQLAKLTQRFTVQSNAVLEWLPQETLFFDGAQAQCRTEVQLHEQASFIGWEAQCFGRPCADALFNCGQIDLGWSVRGNPYAELRERLRLDCSALAAVWGLRGYNSMATLYAYPVNKEQLEQVRSIAEAVEPDSGCTLLDRLLVYRSLGHNVNELRQGMETLWAALRPELVGRAACPPRIWAT